MLDKRTAAVLSAVNYLCAEGTYKVIEAEELLKELPPRFMTESEGLKQMIKYLKDREYIDIKYSDESVYCLCPLPKGRLYFEQQSAEKADGRSKFRKFLTTAFLGAMAGSIIGGIIAAFITTLILS